MEKMNHFYIPNNLNLALLGPALMVPALKKGQQNKGVKEYIVHLLRYELSAHKHLDNQLS